MIKEIAITACIPTLAWLVKREHKREKKLEPEMVLAIIQIVIAAALTLDVLSLGVEAKNYSIEQEVRTIASVSFGNVFGLIKIVIRQQSILFVSFISRT